MTESTAPSAALKRFGTLRERLLANPVTLKELRGRMRGTRAFVVLTVYLVLMSGFASLLYFAYAASTNVTSGPQGQIVGKIVFGGIVGIELFLVCFISPAFTAGAISGERERRTYDLLRTTLLPARSLVTGKLTSAASFIILLLLAAIPLQSLAFLLGGVAPEEVLIAQGILITTALAFGTVGVFFSALMRRTLGASVLTYTFALLSTLGLPLLLLTLVPITSVFYYNSPEPLVEALLIYGGGFLVAINPIATAVATEVILVQEHTAFYFTIPLNNGVTIPLISPWLIYIPFYLLLSAVLLILSIAIVRRVEK
ncbi:MAG: ABC transporter permease [Chloroflexi bacterium]|nr:ABC transporter permease [Chloroflexota bacterium]